DLFQKLVGANNRARPFGSLSIDRECQPGDRGFEKAAGLLMGREKVTHPATQGLVVPARFLQVRVPLVWRQLDRCDEDLLRSIGTGIHDPLRRNFLVVHASFAGRLSGEKVISGGDSYYCPYSSR